MTEANIFRREFSSFKLSRRFSAILYKFMFSFVCGVEKFGTIKRTFHLDKKFNITVAIPFYLVNYFAVYTKVT